MTLCVCLFLATSLNAQTKEAESESTQDDSKRDAFVTWAKLNAEPVAGVEPGQSFEDLQVLKQMIGDARVIGIGESNHFIHESLRARHRLIEFMVEEMGVTAVTMESPLPESKMVYDYVLGANPDPEMWETGLYVLAKCSEVRDLIEWMRAYNLETSNEQKIRFYGTDMTDVRTASHLDSSMSSTI